MQSMGPPTPGPETALLSFATIVSVSMVLSYEEAATVVSREAKSLSALPRRSERLPLLQAAGRIVAEPIHADRDQPPFPRSTRDGFACRIAELTASPLRVAGLLRAGEPWTAGSLPPGTAVEIMTGAAVPPEADTVVMLEHVEVRDARLHLNGKHQPAAGENIVPAGAEAKRGDVLIPAGRRLGPAEIAAAAACGAANPSVFVRPNVAILATGDELVEVRDVPLAHQIRNSNSNSLAVQIAAAGGEPRVLPIVRDEPAATEAAIRQALDSDLVVLSGGVSMGRFDFVEQALAAIGAEFFFTGARIQPGKPVVFGRAANRCFFGLPGNPISTMVTCALFVAPLLRALAGESAAQPRFRQAQLVEDVSVKPGLTRFLPAQVESGVHGCRVRRLPWQGSGDLATAARANAFVVVPESREQLTAGELVSVLEL